jgi:hypothetical protein
MTMRNIEIAEPRTAADIEDLADDIMAVVRHAKGFDADFINGIKLFPHYLTLVYVDRIPAAIIEIKDSQGWPELGKDTLEFGGAVVPEFRHLNLTDLVAPVAIRKAFLERHAKKMLSATPAENKPARMALIRLGFRLIGKDKDKNLLYKLRRTTKL